MARTTPPLEVTAWVEPARAAQAGRVLTALSRRLHTIAVGGPGAKETDHLAGQLGCPLVDDLRKLLVDHPARYLLIDHRPALAAEDIAAALTAGTTILTTEPLAGDLDELAAIATQLAGRGAAGQVGRVHLLPLLIQGEGWRRAADPGQHLASLLSLTAVAIGSARERSLFARLMDLWMTALCVAPLPETVTATLAAPALSQVPDQPRQMTGQLTVHARCADAAHVIGLALTAGDRLGCELSHARFVAAEAMFAVDRHGYTLIAKDGQVIDQHEAQDDDASCWQAVADTWTQILDQPAPAGPPWPDNAQREALACCLACLLSARTGQPESPQRLMTL
jgi:hypothetical protein